MSSGGLVRPEQQPRPTRKAEKEAIDIADGTLRRTEAVRTNIHYAGLFAFWTLVIVLTSLSLVWAWHLGAPEKWRFLNAEQLSDLQKVLLAAVSSSAATQLSKQWFGKAPGGDSSDPD